MMLLYGIRAEHVHKGWHVQQPLEFSFIESYIHVERRKSFDAFLLEICLAFSKDSFYTLASRRKWIYSYAYRD